MMEEVEKLARSMREKKVLLQLPEGLIPMVDEIVEVFEKYGKEVVVDLDPTYGACDIRIGEMKAVGAEAIVHIGHLPMVKLPNVYYIEWKRPVDVDKLKAFLEKLEEEACFSTTANFRWVLEEVKGFPNVIIGKGSWRMPYEGLVLGCDTSACNVEADINLFLGDGYFHPLAIWVNTRRKTLAFRPDGSVEEVSFERVVRKRLALLGSISGKRVGILVSSKIGQNRNPLASQLKRVAKEMGYKPSLYVSDYISPSYIAGLREDFFVYTGCPRVPIDDGDNYPKPIITPEEFLVKLGILEDYRIGWITSIPLLNNEA